jgi:hypothetical protein
MSAKRVSGRGDLLVNGSNNREEIAYMPTPQAVSPRRSRNDTD